MELDGKRTNAIAYYMLTKKKSFIILVPGEGEKEKVLASNFLRFALQLLGSDFEK